MLQLGDEYGPFRGCEGLLLALFAERGWSIFPEQDRTHTILYPDDLAFRKGDYMVGLKRNQDQSPGCNYLMTFVWQSLS